VSVKNPLEDRRRLPDDLYHEIVWMTYAKKESLLEV
jgi:hypothetical protein